MVCSVLRGERYVLVIWGGKRVLAGEESSREEENYITYHPM